MKNKSSVISLVNAIVVMIIGILVIIGWMTYNDSLRLIFPGQVKMKLNVLVLDFELWKPEAPHA